MIMWRGWGALGLFPLVIATLIFVTAAQLGIGVRGDGPQTGAALVLIAAGIWWLGRRLNRGTRTFIEARHSLFMIPLQFYAVPLAAAGAFLAVATLLAPA